VFNPPTDDNWIYPCNKHWPRSACISVPSDQWSALFAIQSVNEPRHDKTNIMGLQPAWIQTSSSICAVWSGSMLFAIIFSTSNRVGKWTACLLIRLRRCAGWSGSMLVANPLCGFCCGVAQIFFKFSLKIINDFVKIDSPFKILSILSAYIHVNNINHISSLEPALTTCQGSWVQSSKITTEIDSAIFL
jgi:hypothetical protein